jgi:putative endonuclease
MANGRNGTLFVGSTDNLRRRVFQHQTEVFRGFTKRYDVKQLVWFEAFELRENAFRRERRIKEWRRSWKVMLIEAANPDWRDLSQDMNQLLSF